MLTISSSIFVAVLTLFLVLISSAHNPRNLMGVSFLKYNSTIPSGDDAQTWTYRFTNKLVSNTFPTVYLFWLRFLTYRLKDDKTNCSLCSPVSKLSPVRVANGFMNQCGRTLCKNAFCRALFETVAEMLLLVFRFELLLWFINFSSFSTILSARSVLLGFSNLISNFLERFSITPLCYICFGTISDLSVVWCWIDLMKTNYFWIDTRLNQRLHM